MRGIYVALLFLHVEVSFDFYIEQVKVDGIALLDVGQVKKCGIKLLNIFPSDYYQKINPHVCFEDLSMLEVLV